MWSEASSELILRRAKESEKRVTTPGTLSPFAQWLEFIPEAKNTFAQHRHFTPKNITLMDHFWSTDG